jgi:arylsulfatase A-like enzyme
MSRKTSLSLLTILALVSITIIMLINNNPRDQSGTQLPNVIFILADDMGYGDPQVLNPESKIPSPNMDQLANEGMYFTDAHSYSGVCTPTRYGVLTGRYCFRTRVSSGVLGGHDVSLIEPGRETVATLLGRAGYRSACVGKWHLGLDYKKKDPDKLLYVGPNFGNTKNTDNVDYSGFIDGEPYDHGFDYSYIFPASLDMQPYIYINNKKVVNTDLEHIDGVSERERGLFWRHGDAEKDFDFYDVLPRLTRHGMGFIRDHQSKYPDRPFFLYFPLTAPHTPWVPSESFIGISGAGLYGDFVHQVDHSLGKIMQLVDSLEIRSNTIIILTSDNGSHWKPEDIAKYDHRANAHFRGMKSDVWEGGHRVPFLVKWPGIIPAGSSSRRMICHNDLLATMAELTGQQLDWNAGEDSFSYLSALTRKESDWTERRTMINQAVSTTLAIRKDNWKLILDMSSGGWSRGEITAGPPMQLYNLDEDIGEKHNLYRDKPEKVAELEALLHIYRKEGRSRFK